MIFFNFNTNINKLMNTNSDDSLNYLFPRHDEKLYYRNYKKIKKIIEKKRKNVTVVKNKDIENP